MINLLLLAGLAGMAGLAYVSSRRSKNTEKAREALENPQSMKALSIDEQGKVTEDPNAKARAGVVLSAQVGQPVPPGTKLPDGSRVLAVKKNIYNDASAVIEKSDGSIVIAVPVYTNGDVWYYEHEIDDRFVVRPPKEVNGVPLPDLPPLLNLSNISKNLNLSKMIGNIGIGAVTRITSAIAEHNQQWYERKREQDMTELQLSFAYMYAKNTGDVEAMKEILPLYFATRMANKALSAVAAESGARAWATHPGGDEGFNKEKVEELRGIAQRESLEVSIMADILKSIGADADVRVPTREEASKLKSSLESSYAEKMGNYIRSQNAIVEAMNEEMRRAAQKATALTGRPNYGQAEMMFMMTIERAGGDPAKIEQALRDILEQHARYKPSTAGILNLIEESTSPSAPEALKKIKENPQLNALYEKYKEALTKMRPEFAGKVGVPLTYTAGIEGSLFRAGVDAQTIQKLQEKFPKFYPNIIAEYVKGRYAAVGFDGLEDWEKKAYAIYVMGLPPELARDIGSPGKPAGAQYTSAYRPAVSSGVVTNVPATQKDQQDQAIISQLDDWIKGKMSDADIIKAIDRWVKEGRQPASSASPGLVTNVPSTQTPSKQDQAIVSQIDSWVKGKMSDADIIKAIDSWVKGGDSGSASAPKKKHYISSADYPGARHDIPF